MRSTKPYLVFRHPSWRRQMPDMRQEILLLWLLPMKAIRRKVWLLLIKLMYNLCALTSENGMYFKYHCVWLWSVCSLIRDMRPEEMTSSFEHVRWVFSGLYLQEKGWNQRLKQFGKINLKKDAYWKLHNSKPSSLHPPPPSSHSESIHKMIFVYHITLFRSEKKKNPFAIREAGRFTTTKECIRPSNSITRDRYLRYGFPGTALQRCFHGILATTCRKCTCSERRRCVLRSIAESASS